MIRLCAFADEYSKYIDEQIKGLHENGIGLIELRNVDGKNVNDISLDEAKECYDKLSKANIQVWSIGSPLGKVDIDCDFKEYEKKIRHICEIANIMHTDKIRMFSFFKAYESKDKVIAYLQKMVEIGKEYNVYMYHENEKEIYGDTVSRVYELKEAVPELKLVYDPANYIQCGQDCNYAMDKLFDKIDYFHIKDVISETQELVPAGYGDGKIDDLVGRIYKDVVLTIEPHLFSFEGYNLIDDSQMKNKFKFANNQESFKCAVDAIKKILKDNGYVFNNGGYVKTNPKVVRYGIIGLGNIGTTHMKNFMKSGNIPNAIVTAISDLKPEKIKKIQDTYPNCMFDVYSSGKELIDNANVDAVIVAAPHYQHPELCIRALKKGLNVICEKPAGVYTKQVKEMMEVAKESKGLFTMMFNQRTNCLYRKMRELIASGEVGTIKRVNWIITDWYRSQSYYDSGDWRATWSGEGGGVLFNQCPHQLDLLSWVVGAMPNKVQAFCHFGKWHDIEVEDDVTAYLEYANGATGVFVTSTADAPGTNRFEVLGTGGKLVCENGKLVLYKNEIDERQFNKEYKGGFGSPKYTVTTVETDNYNPQHTGICRNFTNAILGKEPLFVDGKEGINGVVLMDAMLLSTWLNKSVDLPFDDDLYLSELQKRIINSRKKDNVIEQVFDTFNSVNQ